MHIRQLFSFRRITATCHFLGKLDRHFDKRDRHQGVESSDIVISSATFKSRAATLDSLLGGEGRWAWSASPLASEAENERVQMAIDPLAQFSTKSADQILEPMDRISEVLFGLIMALTFTLTLGVVTAKHPS
jgi:hypothetical protein